MEGVPGVVPYILTAEAAPEPAEPPSEALQTVGRFERVVDWPVIMIHAIVLPDSRVLSYGQDPQGESGRLVYDVWNPIAGFGENSHLTLPKPTKTNIFCSAQILIPDSGNVLFTGGDQTIGDISNYGTAEVEFFNYANNAMTVSPNRMASRRWYPTLVTLKNGDVVVLGGHDTAGKVYSPTPEIYSPKTGWRQLMGAANQTAYGVGNWNYPKAWQSPVTQEVFVLSQDGSTFLMDPTTPKGSVRELTLTLNPSDPYLPGVMFAPGRILSLRQNATASIVDINSMTPSAQPTAGPSQDRYHANATLMADGKVFLNGGAKFWNWDDNTATGIAYQSEIWDPTTAQWTPAASATQMRLYHSSALLLPDARVLTGGGGAPGPVSNFNAEVYEPPYLFMADGNYAPRPQILLAPGKLSWGKPFDVTLDAATQGVKRVTLVKTGSVTHANNFDQRFMDLTFAPNSDEYGNIRSNQITVQAPANSNIATPGFYMLFVFDQAGTPSMARIVKVGS
jgi:hypothetical protein